METYEKKYKELEGKIKKAYLYAQTDSTKAVLEEILPELAESEDEKIRKSIIENLKGNMYRADGDYDLLNKQIAWLEKQVPVDKDKVVKGVRRCVATSLINYIDANSKGMCLSNIECEDIDDAIVNNEWYKVYCYMKKKLEKQEEKPQGKSALEAIEEEKVDNANKVEAKFVNKIESWSEEDEKNLIEVISIVQNISSYNKPYDGYIDWLKSLRNRVQPQKQWKPSEEQMNALDSTLQYSQVSHDSYEQLNSLYNDLKKLMEE